jgi:hypothetical protein
MKDQTGIDDDFYDDDLRVLAILLLSTQAVNV